MLESPKNDRFPMVRYVPYIGVIWAVNEANKLGFGRDPGWCNLGQGQPEVGPIEGAPERILHVDMELNDASYGPVGGTLEMREAVADWINRTHRRGRKPYTAENISFAAGGRLALTRLFGIFADGAKIGYRNPDYTAYEDYLFGQRQRCALSELRAGEDVNFNVTAEAFDAFLHNERPDAFLFSNPCNPTGQVADEPELERVLASARRAKCLLGIDEFYSNYVYKPDGSPADGPISALSVVNDPDEDPLVVFNGMTKGFRYAGWRAGWAAGPAYVIDMINRSASAIDGGPSMMVQRASMKALEPGRAEAELEATRRVFAKKRRLMLDGLAKLGIHTAADPLGTFYVWASVADLPGGLDDSERFFRACLEKKVMTVPGHFFDLRPWRSRPSPEPFRSWVRFSYGPDAGTVAEGLRRIGEVVAEARQRA